MQEASLLRAWHEELTEMSEELTSLWQRALSEGLGGPTWGAACGRRVAAGAKQ